MPRTTNDHQTKKKGRGGKKEKKRGKEGERWEGEKDKWFSR